MRKSIIAASALTLATGLVAPAAAHARPAPAPSGRDGCDVGTAAPLASVKSLADGGKIYRYNVAGQINEVPIPPKGFNPTTANAKTLATYGLPERPKNLTAKSAWTQQMRRFKPTSDPGLCVTPYRSRTAGAPDTAATTHASGNWAGYTARKKKKTSYYVGATGDFVQTGKHKSCSGSTWVGWVGIGGYYKKSPALIQAGTGRLSGHNHAWYEYLGRGNRGIPITYMKGVKVGGGQHIHSTVIYQRSTHLTTFYVYNTTNGTYQAVHKKLSKKYYYDGRTAEQIDERITRGQSLTPLYHFGSDGWSGARAMRASNGKWVGLGTQPHTRIVMRNNGHDLAAPGKLSGTQRFTDHFKRCT